MSKEVANEILGVFEKYRSGECSRDRALEDISKTIDRYVDQRPIMGYINSGFIRNTLGNLIINATQVSENKYQIQYNQFEFEELQKLANVTINKK